MCGIGFMINYEKDPYDISILEYIFKNMESRGDDASGIYYERPNEKGEMQANVFKAPVCAEELWDCIHKKVGRYKLPDGFKSSWGLNGTERLVMMHTRAATKGTVANNHNNMPIYSDNWVLIHNGVLSNNARIDSFKYKGEVDSEDFLASLETTGSIAKAIKETKGSMAIAARRIGKDYLYLYRNNNPLEVAIPTHRKMVFGCSMGSYIIDANSILKLGEASPFLHGHKVHPIEPYTIYKVDITKPDIRAIAEYQPALGIVDASDKVTSNLCG
jgi:glucosamine 6-phosphate synthetase-like amidotransferase/phosphosugar isomerase protein